MESQVTIVKCDVAESTALCEILEVIRPDQVYHLASASTKRIAEENPMAVGSGIICGTLGVLEAARRVGFSVLFVSSSEVYGQVEEASMPLREEMQPRPAGMYSVCKLSGELLCEQYVRSYGVNAVRVRPFPHIGPVQAEKFVCAELALQVAEIESGKRRPEITVGDLSHARDFVDVRDIVRGYWAALNEGRPGELYHLASGVPTQISTILDKVLELTDVKIAVTVDQARLRPGEILASWGDPRKSAELIGWRAGVPLAVTLKDILESARCLVRER